MRREPAELERGERRGEQQGRAASHWEGSLPRGFQNLLLIRPMNGKALLLPQHLRSNPPVLLSSLKHLLRERPWL